MLAAFPSTALPDARPAVQVYGKVERDTGEYGEAEPMIVEERAKGCFALARANPPQMLNRESESDRKSKVISRAHRIAKTDEHHRAEINRVAERDRRYIEAAECQRRCANADVDVVVPIDHRVFGVVSDDPEKIDDQQHPGEQRHGILHGSERHRDAERKCDSEERLRKREEALEKWIG